MTDYARFSGAFYPEVPLGPGVSQPYCVFSSDRLTVTVPTTGNGRATAWVGAPKTSGKWRLQYQYGNNPGGLAFFGIVDSGTSLNASGNPPDLFAGANNGNIYLVSGGSVTTVVSGSTISDGDYLQVVYDMGAKLAWARFILSGTPQNWNGSGTADPDTGVGGVSISNITPAIPAIQAINGLTNEGITINTGGSAYAAPMPTTYSDLPATLSLSSAQGFEGEEASFVWADSSCGTLEYILDGGSPITAGGTNSGTGGTATTAGTLAGIAIHSVALSDGANTLDQTQTEFFWTAPDPGTSTVLESTTGTLIGGIGGPPPRPNVSGTFTPTDYLEFSILVNEVFTIPASDTALNGAVLIYATNQANPFLEINYLDTAGGSLVCSFNMHDMPTSGANSFTVTGAWGAEGDEISTLCTGTITVTSAAGDIPVGDIVVNYPGGTTTWTNVQLSSEAVSSANCLETWFVQSSTGFMPYGLALYGASPSEILTLLTATTPPGGGTLSITGTVTYATPSNVDISSTGTAGTFSPAGSYTLTGGVIDASNGALSPGTYSIAIRDHDNTSVISNALSLVVSLESLLLQTATAVPGGTLTVGGVVFNGTPTNLDISTDGGTTWAENTAFSLSAGTFTASGGTLTAGTYPVVVRDHDLPSVVSNTETLVLSSESLTLTSAGGIIGSNLTFAGVSNNGPPSAIDVSLNGTWSLASELVSGGGTVNVPYSGNGPIIPSAGTYTVQTRDHGYPYVLSNTLTVALSTTETLHLSSATGTFGGVLALAGTSAGATPAGLNVSLDGGTAYGPTSGYSNVSGSWTASSGFTLTAGVFVVQVQDSVNLGVVSNAITLTIDAPTETILLESAAGVAGAFLGLSGVTSNGPAAALNFTLDDGATWAPTTSYDSTGNTLSDPWTANGTPLSPGGYVVRVQDADNLGVISNPITLVVPPPSSGGGTTTTNTSFGISPNGRTIFLNPATWDWVLDTDGNIAVANDPYATAQDVSSACRLFLGECWYNTTAGVPYFGDILGKSPSLPYLTAQLEKAALSVPTVVKAKAVITGLQGRAITGQVQITQANGTSQTVTI